MRGLTPACGMEYINCVLGSGGASKIPDTSTKHTVAIEYRATATIKPDTGGHVTVACLPGLPGSLRVLSGIGTFVNSAGGVSTITTNTNGLTVPFAEWIAPSTDGKNFEFNAGKQVISARLVKQSLEVMQVGPILNQQGHAATAKVANPCGMVVWPQAFDYSAADALYGGLTFANLKEQAIFRTAFPPNNWTFEAVSVQPTSKLCSATEPCLLLGTGCGDFVSVNMPSPTIGASFSSDTVNFTSHMDIIGSTGQAWFGVNNTVLMPLIPSTNDFTLNGDLWTDNDCEMLIWAGAGLGTDTSFEARVSVCLELDISPVSSDYRPFVSAPAVHDPVQLETVDRVMKIMPSSVSKNGGGMQSWWNTITTGVTGVADILKDVGIPVVSPVAGMVGKLSKAIGGLFM